MANSPKKINALVIDQSKMSVRSAERILRSIADFEVVDIDNFRDAVKLIAANPPHLILAEWKINDLTVLEFLQVLKSRNAWTRIPVIVYASRQFLASAQKAMELGAYKVFPFPLEESLIRSALERFLPKKTVSTEQLIPESETKLLRQRINRIQQTASLPTLVPKILKVSNDPSSSAKTLGQVIKQDQSLTAKILKIVNSAFYGLYRKVGNVDHAIVILGFDEIRNLSTAACLIKAHEGIPSQFFQPSEFWAHSLCTAYVAKALSAKRPDLNTEDAFVIGLLHDYGKVILFQFFNTLFREVLALAAGKKQPLNKICDEHLTINHAEIGGIIAENWKLPGPLAKAVRFHHAPATAHRHEYNIHLAHLANALTHKFGIGASGNPVPDEPSPESLKIFGFEGVDLQEVWDSLNVDMDTIHGFMEISSE